MCFRRPSPPPLPEPEPVDSAVEQTAQQVVVGEKRKQLKSPTKKKSAITPTTGRRRLGTRSLQIPLLANTGTNMGNLNYPT
tara:strand:+ start:1659 stop:1901 length:243 start_codon:yes stop_codon:yes gene_type:complete